MLMPQTRREVTWMRAVTAERGGNGCILVMLKVTTFADGVRVKIVKD